MCKTNIVMKSTKTKIIITIIVVSLVSILFYFTTGERYYGRDFKENTQLELPNSAKLVSHDQSSSFGDYSICYTYEFSRTEVDNLYTQLINIGFKKSKGYLETDETDNFFSTNSKHEVEKILIKDSGFKSYEAIFLSDRKTVLFNSNKW